MIRTNLKINFPDICQDVDTSICTAFANTGAEFRKIKMLWLKKN